MLSSNRRTSRLAKVPTRFTISGEDQGDQVTFSSPSVKSGQVPSPFFATISDVGTAYTSTPKGRDPMPTSARSPQSLSRQGFECQPVPQYASTPVRVSQRRSEGSSSIVSVIGPSSIFPVVGSAQSPSLPSAGKAEITEATTEERGET